MKLALTLTGVSVVGKDAVWPVETWNTFLTVDACGEVLAVLAHRAAFVVAVDIHGSVICCHFFIKVTLSGVPVAVAGCKETTTNKVEHKFFLR